MKLLSKLLQFLWSFSRRPSSPPTQAPSEPGEPTLALVRFWSSGRIALLEYRPSIEIPGINSVCRECIELGPEEFSRNGLALVQERLNAYLERPPGDDTDYSPATRKAWDARNAHHVGVTRRSTGVLELRPMLRSGPGRVGIADTVQELAPPITDEAFHTALDKAFRDSGSKLV